MNLPGEEEPTPSDQAPADSSAERPRPTPEDLDRMFGTVLSEVTGDERGLADRRGDDWYLTNRPPHHG